MSASDTNLLREVTGQTDWSRVSPTQVDMFRRCPRKWFNAYILGLKAPPSAAMQLGSAVHNLLETYLKMGVHPLGGPGKAQNGLSPPGGLAQNVAAFGIDAGLVPRPGTVTVEGRVQILGAPLPMVGIIDVVDPADPDTGIAIHDHKTSSGKGRLKTPAELAADVQMLSYGHHGLTVLDTDAPRIRLRHIYYGTPGKRGAKRRWSDERETVVSRARIEEGWEGICLSVSQMIEVAKLEEPGVEQNPQACTDYSGCEYNQRCWGGASAVSATATISSAPATVRNVPMTTATRKPNPLAAMLGVGPAPVPKPPNGSTGDSTAVDALPEAAQTDVNPPESALPDPPPPEAPPADVGLELGAGGQTKPKRRRRRNAEEIARDKAYAEANDCSESTASKRRYEAEALAAAESASETAEEPPAASPAPQTPPTPVANPLAGKLAGIAAPSPAPEDPSAPVAPPAVAETAPPVSGSVQPAQGPKYLFVGCVPLKGGLSFIEFGQWVTPVQVKVAAVNGVPHIAAIDFGKGYGYVAAHLPSVPWPEGVDAIVFDPMSPWSKHCLDIMVTKADIVVRKL